MVGWGLFIGTVLLYHTTFLVNSVTHLLGTRRFDTDDDSRNNWWEIDVTHYMLKLLSWVGIVCDLKTPPAKVYAEAEASGRLAGH
ncbi:MAG: hypothetical protein OEU54_08145 [Gemmatimonadota bacterium]|nr:hypothetical protein [Gemmatimonadota bacterium]